MDTNALSALSVEQLTTRLAALIRLERGAIVDGLWTLVELERRKLHLALGYASVFDYCHRGLLLSKGTAYARMVGTELLARFPAIDAYLRDGRLSATTLAALRHVLTEDNHLQVLDKASGLTEDEVKHLAAGIAPKPPVKNSLRRVPVRPVPTTATRTSTAQPDLAPASARTTSSSAPPESPASTTLTASTRDASSTSEQLFVLEGNADRPAHRPRLTPRSADHYALKMNVPVELARRIEQVADALGVAKNDFETIFLECTRITLEHLEKKRLGVERKKKVAAPPSVQAPAQDAGAPPGEAPVQPGASELGSGAELRSEKPESPVSRYIPKAVRREVMQRDGGRCAFVGVNGVRCSERRGLQFDHIVAFAHGGTNEASNLRVVCFKHNQYCAEQLFGEEKIRREREKRHARPEQVDGGLIEAWAARTPRPTGTPARTGPRLRGPGAA